ILYYVTGQRLDYWDPNVFLAALAAGIASLVAVSLLTRSEPADDLSSFFDRLETSSDGDGDEPTDVPLLLVHFLRPREAAKGRGWRAYREDLEGFVLGWLVVIALVAMT